MIRRLALMLPLALALPAGASVDLSFDAAVAKRSDEFRWNIAGDIDGTSPNILSELTWEDLEIQELRLGAEALMAPWALFKASWAGGRITGGKNQDSDYAGDDRTFEFSRSNNSGDMGETRDMSLGVGWPLGDPADALLTPMAGWGQASQRVFLSKGNQTLDPYGVIGFTGPFSGLNSHYEHRWRGFWLGADARMRLSPRAEVGAFFRLHTALDYRAEADWNLRPQFRHPKSYEHTGDGKGWDVALSFLYDLTERSALSVGLDWRQWRVRDGEDRTFFSDGTEGVTRLNEVEWDSLSFRLSYRFRPTPRDLSEKEDPF